ncbi:hypothetical protein LXL04_011654 [Taraxacum kok-saghyz]
MSAMVSQGKIHRIELENFKSYKGHQVIGPFFDFTAIIGPNGSGKSNLLDAISFVLGVRTSQLRGEQLKDLIYAFDDRERGQSGRRALVKLVYRLEDGTELLFTRTITSAGGSEYRIDNRVVNWNDYNARLKSLGILVKARNFLVFQGDVESIACKTPKELTALLEQISGSDEDKSLYKDLEEKKGAAEEKCTIAYQKKKTIIIDRKQKKVQKEEAQKHIHLQQELISLKKEHFLWQLFNIENDVEKSNKEIQAERSSLQEITNELGGYENESRKKEKEQAKYRKEIDKREKKLEEKNNTFDKYQQELLKPKEEKFRLHAKLENTEKELEKRKEEKKNYIADIKKLQNDLMDINNQLNNLQSEKGKLQFHLGDHHLEAYNRIKEEAGVKTIKLREEKEVHDKEQHADMEAEKNLEQNLQQLESRKQELESQQDQTETRLKNILEAIDKHNKELKRLSQEQTDISKKLEDSKEKYKTMRDDISKLEDKLYELKAEKHENESDRKMLETVEALMCLFPGVYGRMSFEATQNKYKTAVKIAMGRFKDAVVVDNENTGKECVKYLKDHRLPSITFIPLHSIGVEPIIGKLRALRGTARLIYDVIQYPFYFYCNYWLAVFLFFLLYVLDKAIQYAVGNTLVCDDLDEAKRLSWTGEGYKVVTVDGILLTKAGTITVFIRGDEKEEKSHKRGETHETIEGLKKEKEKLKAELQEMGSIREMQLKESKVSEKISELQKKIYYADIEKEHTKEKHLKLKGEYTNIINEIGDTKPHLLEIRGKISSRKNKIESLKNRINEIVDKIYKRFSESVGVENIREYEENRLVSAEEMLSLRNQQSKIKCQLEYEKKRDMGARITKLEESRNELKNKLLEVDERENQVKSIMEKATNEIATLKEEIKEWKSRLEVCEKELIEWKIKISSTTTNKTNLKKKIDAKENSITQLNSKKQDILDKCELDQITLPMDESAPVSVYDFSQLNRSYQCNTSPEEREKLEMEFKQKIGRTISKIEGMVLNIKALDQYDALQEKEKAAIKEFEEAKDEAKQIAMEFETVRTRRLARFMEAFNKISSNIEKIYKELTKSRTHPVGGSAYLNLENEDEPFLHGVNYTVMPPTKRFFEMEQLSGGEKTVAALALLFSIHSYKPSPFFILDEVDAALDNLNVARVAEFIRSKAYDEGLQSIVISLKDSFYSKAQAMVGVYRDFKTGCSRTLTIDLTKYPES